MFPSTPKEKILFREDLGDLSHTYKDLWDYSILYKLRLVDTYDMRKTSAEFSDEKYENHVKISRLMRH